MAELRPILLVEDSLKDIELVLAALKKNNFANEVVVARDGAEALDLLPVVMLTSSREEEDLVKSYRLGVNAYVVKPVGFQQFVDAIKQTGMFWAVINEPPPVGPAD